LGNILTFLYNPVAKGIVVLPKSVTPPRVASNYTGSIAALEKLDASDIKTLDGLAAGGKQKRSACHFLLSCLPASADTVFDVLHRFITPPWRKSPYLILKVYAYLCDFGSAVDLGFENWPKLP
jgi:hypothetical protein